MPPPRPWRGSGLLLGELGLDLVGQLVVIGLDLGGRLVDGVGLGLLVGDELLLLGPSLHELALVVLERLLEVADVLDGVHLLLGDLVGVVDVAHELAEVVGAEDEGEKARLVTHLVLGGEDVGKLGLLLLELLLLLGDRPSSEVIWSLVSLRSRVTLSRS